MRERHHERDATPGGPARWTPAVAVAVWLVAGLIVTIAAGWALGDGLKTISMPRHEFIDEPIARQAAAGHNPALTAAMKTVTFFGNRVFALALMLVVALVLWLASANTGAASFLAASVVGGYAVSQVVKHVVHRMRPGGGLVHASGSSFPSGHAIAAVTLYAGLALVVSRWRSTGPASSGNNVPLWVRAVVWAGAVALILLIGVSRVYLGVHWTSDVLGGALIGAIWTSICAAAWSHLDKRPARRTP